MKKVIASLVVVSMFFPLLLFPILLGDAEGDGSSGIQTGYEAVNLPEAVLKHKPTVEKYCAEYGISDYVDYILAIIMVESGGNAKDVMQSSESLGLAPNSLSTEESIKQGCKYFSELLASSKSLGCDIDSVLQSYNFGGGFLNFVAKNGKQYTLALAEQFSKEKSGGKTVPYHHQFALEHNGGYRYTYGNFYYVKLVRQYLTAVGDGKVLDGIIVFENGWAFPVTKNYSLSRGMNANHGGYDIAAPIGTPIVASKDGKVETVQKWNGIVTYGDMNSYGNMVLVDHGGGIKTRYAHFQSTSVTVGQQVKRGQQLGVCGSTGNSTGPHLHFEYIVNGTRVNPERIIRMP